MFPPISSSRIWRQAHSYPYNSDSVKTTSTSDEHRHSLLIVDDEVSNLQKLRRTFFGDFQIFEAHDGQQAIQILRDRPIDVIITDQRMPSTTGVDILRESLLLQPEAVRIILTGYTEIEYLMDAINEGQVHRYITKPWEPFTLKKTVQQDLELVRLKRENRLWQEQLRIAHQVQSRLFPQKLPPIVTLQYSGICQPAGEVGGDYYDVLQISPHDFCVAVGDISGKGISAALLMASLQALLRSHISHHGEDLCEIVQEVNRSLCSLTEESRFASLFCALYDDRNRCLTYVNAGHNPPLLLSTGGPEDRLTEPSLHLLEGGGAVLGMFPEAEYEQRHVSLERGDTVVIYTDGVVEVQDRGGHEFGEDRLVSLALENRQLSPMELQAQLLQEVRRFAGGTPLADDLTLLILKVV